MAVTPGDPGQGAGRGPLVSVTLGQRNFCVNEDEKSHDLLLPY